MGQKHSDKRSDKRQPKEFKKEAVALIRDQGYSVPEAAESLGVASNLLYRWKDQQEALSVGSGLVEEDRTLRTVKEMLQGALG